MRLLYVLASYVLFAVLFPVLSLHRKTRHGLRQRLGFYAEGELPARGPGPTIWMHGASAGDLLALSPMFGPLRARFPGCRIVLSTMTNSGYMMGRERLAKQVDGVVYAPYDLWGATRRAVKAIGPELLVLEYTEIWPNLIRAASRAGGRVVLTNGRFSPAQQGKYRLFFGLIGNPLKDMELFLMRGEDEAERVLGLGAPGERVFVTGNTKFDALAVADQGQEDEALRSALGLKVGERVWIAGSTHEGEEEHLLEVYRRLLEGHPDLRLVIAPRYIDRAGRIVGLVKEAGLSVGLRSKGNEEGGQVVVLDTIGELSRAYRLATLVFVGGSFTTRGGQNILEPAGQGKPVLFGPHMENFRDSVQVLVGRGGIQVKDGEQLYRVMTELLAKPETVGSLGELARATVRQISGASQRNVEHMASALEKTTPTAPNHPSPSGRGTG
ncbi:MAG TPA: glycosyltransferase N-terminal domain-containing protein [Archangium sp.]|uniref:3-deoxy-D-manno-octulosonic acid transferase n=1 Tax=Archangium sp. TaxID=1872627 RepID=UPI002E32CE8C|nr:glycosyltransferase N-terminal domain-containing protein [Archangium sp.]HEX5747657.1 glycosyltransferase N-terminal domain-containing protein [Archangium sp.]